MSTNHDLLIEIGTEELPPLALRRLAEAFRSGVDRPGLHPAGWPSRLQTCPEHSRTARWCGVVRT